MANAFQASAREKFLMGDLDWLVHDFILVAVDDTYVYSAAHDFLNDVGAGTRVATSGVLAGKTATNGYAKANDVTFTAVAGDDIEGLWLVRSTGVESTSELVVWWDTKADATPVLLVPNGGDVLVQWHASGLFRV